MTFGSCKWGPGEIDDDGTVWVSLYIDGVRQEKSRVLLHRGAAPALKQLKSIREHRNVLLKAAHEILDVLDEHATGSFGDAEDALRDAVNWKPPQPVDKSPSSG